MGILLPAEQMLRRLIGEFLAPPARIGFTVLEFGDQIITHSDPHQKAEKLYKRLGATSYIAVDGNGRGNVTFDLNRPGKELLPLLPKGLRGGFDLVTDFGTGEHIFDQAQFWRTAHMLTKFGGFLVFDRPSQGYDAHCFWRTDLSTYRDIAAANDYAVIELGAHVGRQNPDGTFGELVSGIFQKLQQGKFRVPQQGRYRKLLRPISGDRS